MIWGLPTSVTHFSTHIDTHLYTQHLHHSLKIGHKKVVHFWNESRPQGRTVCVLVCACVRDESAPCYAMLNHVIPYLVPLCYRKKAVGVFVQTEGTESRTLSLWLQRCIMCPLNLMGCNFVFLKLNSVLLFDVELWSWSPVEPRWSQGWPWLPLTNSHAKQSTVKPITLPAHWDFRNTVLSLKRNLARALNFKYVEQRFTSFFRICFHATPCLRRSQDLEDITNATTQLDTSIFSICLSFSMNARCHHDLCII